MIFSQRNINIDTNLSGECFEKLMVGQWQIGLFSDNIGLDDKKNNKFYKTVINDDIKQNISRCLKNKVKVYLCDGSLVNKHIIHWNKENNYFCITNDIFWDKFD